MMKCMLVIFLVEFNVEMVECNVERKVSRFWRCLKFEVVVYVVLCYRLILIERRRTALGKIGK